MSANVTRRPDGTRHTHTAKPRCLESFAVQTTTVSLKLAEGTLNRYVLCLDQDYDFTSFGDRYTGTKRLALRGNLAELNALHAAIGKLIDQEAGR